MMDARWFVIVNPVAGSGKGLTDWPIISKLLRDNGVPFDAVFTERKYHATELTVEAVNHDYRHIIVVGGDGTLHECVNALFIQKKVAPTDVTLAVIAVGTGNDWVRMFGIPRQYTDAIRAVVSGNTFLQDVGRVSYFESKFPQVRYMANMAGVGFDAIVNRAYNRLKERGTRGKWVYVISAVLAMFQYRSKKMRVWIDDRLALEDTIFSAAVGIGKYNGGGMQQTPNAIADDGLFDMTTIRKLSYFNVIRFFGSLYNGTIYNVPNSRFFRGRRITIEIEPESVIEIDGEALGYSTFRFEVIRRAIKVIVGPNFSLKASV